MKLLESIKTGQQIGKYLTGKESTEELRKLKTWIEVYQINYDIFKRLSSLNEVIIILGGLHVELQ